MKKRLNIAFIIIVLLFAACDSEFNESDFDSVISEFPRVVSVLPAKGSVISDKSPVTLKLSESFVCTQAVLPEKFVISRVNGLEYENLKKYLASDFTTLFKTAKTFEDINLLFKDYYNEGKLLNNTLKYSLKIKDERTIEATYEVKEESGLILLLLNNLMNEKKRFFLPFASYFTLGKNKNSLVKEIMPMEEATPDVISEVFKAEVSEQNSAKIPDRPVLKITEILADPPADITGDANKDGKVSSTGDEFIELYNPGKFTEDLTDVKIVINETEKFRFPDNFLLQAGSMVVLFGGGEIPKNNEKVNYFLVKNGLNLKNSGGTIKLILKKEVLDEFTYGLYGNKNRALFKSEEGFITTREDIICSPGIIEETINSGKNPNKNRISLVRNFSEGFAEIQLHLDKKLILKNLKLKFGLEEISLPEIRNRDNFKLADTINGMTYVPQTDYLVENLSELLKKAPCFSLVSEDEIFDKYCF